MKKYIILFLFIIIIVYIYYNNQRLEKFSNYNGDYFYFNETNINNKNYNDEMVIQSQEPYLKYSPCDYGYQEFPKIKYDNKTYILYDKILKI